MTKAEDYRLRAKKGRGTSQQNRDPVTKQGFLDIARQWREMAERAERHGW
jgi:hypothetical protein